MFISYLSDGPDKVELTPANTTYSIEEGTDLPEITCTATCEPTCDIIWVNERKTEMSAEGKLNLHNVTRERNGTYTCIAKNAATSARTNASIVLDVKCK